MAGGRHSLLSLDVMASQLSVCHDAVSVCSSLRRCADLSGDTHPEELLGVSVRRANISTRRSESYTRDARQPLCVDGMTFTEGP